MLERIGAMLRDLRRDAYRKAPEPRVERNPPRQLLHHIILVGSYMGTLLYVGGRQ